MVFRIHPNIVGVGVVVLDGVRISIACKADIIDIRFGCRYFFRVVGIFVGENIQHGGAIVDIHVVSGINAVARRVERVRAACDGDAAALDTLGGYIAF